MICASFLPRQIAVQVALVFAKVARFDYPSEWPALFSDLMGGLAGGSPLHARRWADGRTARASVGPVGRGRRLLG